MKGGGVRIDTDHERFAKSNILFNEDRLIGTTNKIIN
jgi:hypothetical protein